MSLTKQILLDEIKNYIYPVNPNSLNTNEEYKIIFELMELSSIVKGKRDDEQKLSSFLNRVK